MAPGRSEPTGSGKAKGGPSKAGSADVALAYVRELYAIERRAQASNLTGEELIRLRKTEAETAKANGLEPYRYLRYLFARLPHAKSQDDYRALLPQHLSLLDILQTI